MRNGLYKVVLLNYPKSFIDAVCTCNSTYDYLQDYKLVKPVHITGFFDFENWAEPQLLEQGVTMR